MPFKFELRRYTLAGKSNHYIGTAPTAREAGPIVYSIHTTTFLSLLNSSFFIVDHQPVVKNAYLLLLSLITSSEYVLL